jgi:hypothetical protein
LIYLSPTTKKVYSQQDKYKNASSKRKLIATLCCEASGKRFENVMSALYSCWKTIIIQSK